MQFYRLFEYFCIHEFVKSYSLRYYDRPNGSENYVFFTLWITEACTNNSFWVIEGIIEKYRVYELVRRYLLQQLVRKVYMLNVIIQVLCTKAEFASAFCILFKSLYKFIDKLKLYMLKYIYDRTSLDSASKTLSFTAQYSRYRSL